MIYAKAYGRYGAPRIAADIRAEGYQISVNTVSKDMKRMNLRSKLSRKYRNVSYLIRSTRFGSAPTTWIASSTLMRRAKYYTWF